MSNPAIHPQANGDVDITVPDEHAQGLDTSDTEPEASVDPANLDHPEEIGGE